MTAGRAWEALPLRLRAALAAGATVVTPNNRLARRLTALYDEVQRATGRRAWEAPVVLPWSAWLERLWQRTAPTEPDARVPRLVSVAQSAFLWRRIVVGDRLPLIDERGLCALAADAWSIVHAWGAGGESWRGFSGGDDDRQAFVRWADDYARRLVAADAVDAAQLPDWVARLALSSRSWQGESIVLAGFIDETPQQQRLAYALAAAGASIERCASVSDAAGTVWTVAATTPRDEALRALQWARERVLSDPHAMIGVAIEDLGSRREEIRALADEVLCPALQWPGNEDVARPYNLSLGVPASSIPLLGAALDLIALAHAALPRGRAAALLRSPYLGSPHDGWLSRSRLEADWLTEGQRRVGLDETIAALADVDRVLFERWRHARDSARPPSSATSREWAQFWRAWIEMAGWPGERPLSSSEWQTRELWDELLGEFATFGVLAQRIAASDALAALVALADGHVFQPESTGARVQILGGLEAAGLPFDALWIAGLAAEVWPPAPRPNPLLPLAWQRERDTPHATAARELAYAQQLTAQWTRGAPEVVFSYARHVDDHERAVSLLVPEGRPLDAPAPTTTAALQLAAAPGCECIRDDLAPALAAGARMRGGATLIDAQSNCPFQAVARHRLGVERWPRLAIALLPVERGTLVHAALAAFWRDVRDHSMLAVLAPDALGDRIAAAAGAAMSAVPAARWRNIPEAVRAGEALRIASILREWLESFERVRPSFAVEAIELERLFSLSGVELALRIDRVDRLATGGLAIIDYKTGDAKTPAAWFDARPQAPQIGLYVLAERVYDERPIRAAAYAQLKSAELAVRGIAADPDAWPALRSPGTVRGAGLADWNAAEARWTQTLEALAAEVRDGCAAVSPRDGRFTCRTCGRQALCRIGAPATDEIDEGGDG